MTERSRRTVVRTGAAGRRGRPITKALVGSADRAVLVDRVDGALRRLEAARDGAIQL